MMLRSDRSGSRQRLASPRAFRPRGHTTRARSSIAAMSVLTMLAACGDDPSGPADDVAVTFATQAPADVSDAATATSAPDEAGADPAPTDPAPTDVPPTDPADGSTIATTAAPSVGPADLGDPVVQLRPWLDAPQPVDAAWRTGDPTMFVVSKPGRILPVRDGVVGAAVLDVVDATSDDGEQGLLGLTFTADGSTAYINHTDNSGDTVIAEYAVGSDGVFDPSSRRELLVIEQPYGNHNGGNVTIGPDGMLYIGMGDGGSGGDPERYSLNVTSLLGKMLRIDPTPSADAPYTVPSDNPFVGVAGARPEIWSVGVRNPWRFSFDRLTGDLWIGDVGQGELEEISVGWAADGGGRGLNFGWSAFEGTARFNDDQPADGATPPIHEYSRSTGGCSVTGGAVYRGGAIAELFGWYVFGDFCNGRIATIRVEDRAVTDVVELGTWPQVVAIREAPDGELVVLGIDGSIGTISPA